MENIYLKETDDFSKFKLFLFLYFKIKKVFKIEKGTFFDICTLPSLEKNNDKFNKKFIKYLKNYGIKNVCSGNISEDLKNEISKNFNTFTGKNTFFENIDLIVEFFSKKKGIKLKENEVCFISDEPELVKNAIEKCKTNVKSFSVLTDKEDLFDNLKEDLSNNNGIYLKINEKRKKVNAIYINCDENNKKLKDYIIKTNTIDIFKIYKNTYHYVKLFYKTKDDKFIDNNKIDKNIIFTDFLKKCIKSDNSKDFIDVKKLKVVNIKKYDWQIGLFQL